MLFVPVPPPSPDPIGIGISVASVVVSLFGKLFGGGTDKNIKKAFEGMRTAVVAATNALMVAWWKLARAVAKLLQGVEKMWVKIINPILEKIARAARRINQIVDKVLRPYLDVLVKIRNAIDYIYNAVFRPILAPLETVRKILTIGRILHIGAARRLDQKILALENKILEPVRVMYGKVNEVGGWLNILADARAVLQQAVLLNSMYAYQGGWVKMWYNAQINPVPAGRVAELKAKATAPSPAEAAAEFREFALQNSGPMVAPINDAVAEVRSQFPV